MEILRAENLSFSYLQSTEKAVDNVSFSVNKGEFITVLGSTGCGKSTLLKILKREVTPLGKKSGKIFFYGNNIETLSDKEAAFKIGYVMQRPEMQIVTDKVWHELAFGLENMGLPKDEIGRRIGEISSFFGIEQLYTSSVDTLSGGQKQILNLASAMAMNPEVLILDEPTSQLDPISASEFISILKKINRELLVTVIIVEHRLEELIPLSDRILVMDKGKKLLYEESKKALCQIRNMPQIIPFMPTSTRLSYLFEETVNPPYDIRTGRIFLEKHFSNNVNSLNKLSSEDLNKKAISIKDLYFRYEKKSPDIIKGLNLDIYSNEILCILGGNGAGKSTTLSVIAGLEKAYSGSIKIFDKKISDYKNQDLYRNCIALLPQDVQTMFVKDTVRDELTSKPIVPFDYDYYANRHPYDLSGGEQQLLALCKVLETSPKILLLDEPTKGLDVNYKNKLIEILKQLKSQGLTIVVVSHDIEFAAQCADRCALFFNGSIASIGKTSAFFNDNNFYTTVSNKITRGYYENIITFNDLKEICFLNKRN